jgi:multidrug efflux pump subunit AcrA (membrane-fusion protein)
VGAAAQWPLTDALHLETQLQQLLQQKTVIITILAPRTGAQQAAAAAANPLLTALQTPIAAAAPLPLALNLSAQQAIAKLNASLAIGGVLAQEPMTCVLVKNVTMKVTLDELRPIFEAFGNVKRLAYVEPSRIPDAKPETQCAIVEFETAVTAKITADGLNNFPLGGTILALSVITLSSANKLLEIDTSTFRRVVLEDMVTYEDTLDPDLNEEISEEARNYGTLEKVDINVDSKREATVVLLYAEPEHAAKALKAMNGRAFGGKKIKAVLAP